MKTILNLNQQTQNAYNTAIFSTLCKHEFYRFRLNLLFYLNKYDRKDYNDKKKYVFCRKRRYENQ